MTLCPLPCWDDLPVEEQRVRIAGLVEAITAQTRRRLRQAQARPLGARRILRQHPHSRPRRIARSTAPRFHAASWQVRKMLEAMYRSYRDAYRDARDRLPECRVPVRFPSHGIPPPMVDLLARA